MKKKCAVLRVDGVFLFNLEPGDLEDEDDEDGYDLTTEGHDRIVAKFIAEHPNLNDEHLEIVDVKVEDEDD